MTGYKGLTQSLKALCVGADFVRPPTQPPAVFPTSILIQTGDFDFTSVGDLLSATQLLASEPDLAVVLLDMDGEPLPNLLHFQREARRLRPQLPIVAFSRRSGDRVRYLLREGAAWHFTKSARALTDLRRALGRVLDLNGEAPNGIASMPAIANPFVVGRPLVGASEQLYVGRGDVFDWFTENLTGPSEPNPMLLFGRRRMGKTSTLYQLVQGHRGRDLRAHRDRPLFCAYVDLQRLAGCRTREWLTRLASEIHRQAAPQISGASPIEVPTPGDSPYTLLERVIEGLEAALPSAGLLLVAVDELEQLRAGVDSGLLDPAVLPFLRSQIQRRSRVAYLFSGTNALLDPYWRSILDLVSRHELGPLDRRATDSLIRAPLSGIVSVEEEAVERIWQATGGHPFQIQTICHHLVSLLNRDARRDALRSADVDCVLRTLEREVAPGRGPTPVGDGITS